MRISKMIVALLVSVVAVTAMTGVAVAAPGWIAPVTAGSVDIPVDGTNVTVPLKVWGFVPDWAPGQTHTVNATTTHAGNGGAVTDLKFVFINETGAEESTWLNSSQNFQWTDNSDPEFITLIIKTDANPPVDSTYTITITDAWSSPGYGTDISAGTIAGQGIPEFATIAIPAIAVLGLFLFFNKRKHKKD